jgi:hypothetical protein
MKPSLVVTSVYTRVQNSTAGTSVVGFGKSSDAPDWALPSDANTRVRTVTDEVAIARPACHM